MKCCLIEYVSNSPEETLAAGKNLSHKLQSGSVIALYGGLGSGKTCLVKGIAQGLGITETITSPTYTIINEYAASKPHADACSCAACCPLYHIDAYRLNGDEDFESTGAGEIIGSRGITIIEWSERIPRSIPPGSITIHIEITGPNNRLIRIEGLT
ncbi:MAG: tRNA (adenosine(37)-N6)-threonylcarbamoyltransferase complex ATPase subunit type 1 TsaE [Treponema sp.]|nr:tRNA (adenosine(37)-N6)-threonylcarbamoyltransferase complex ATPase subunit type 1 TsaE [Treponema sp.]